MTLFHEERVAGIRVGAGVRVKARVRPTVRIRGSGRDTAGATVMGDRIATLIAVLP